MTLSSRSRKYLHNMIDSLHEQHLELQSLLADFVSKTTASAREWVESSDQRRMTFDDVVGMLSFTSGKLLANMDFITGASSHNDKKPQREEHENTSSCLQMVENADLKDSTNNDKKYQDILSRLEIVEASGVSFSKMEKDIEGLKIELKQSTDRLGTNQNEMENKIKNLFNKHNSKNKTQNKQFREIDTKVGQLKTEIMGLKQADSESEILIKDMAHSIAVIAKDFKVLDSTLDSFVKEINNKTEAIDKMLLKSAKQQDEFNTKHGVVCKILLQRLAPIDHAMNVLNTTSMWKRNQTLQVSQMRSELSALKAQLRNLDRIPSSQPNFIGFSATLNMRDAVIGGSLIKGFSEIILNIGHHFNPTTGVFVAPKSGVYVASFHGSQINDGFLFMHMVHLDRSREKVVSLMRTNGEYTSTGCSVIVIMNQNDKLFVRLITAEGEARLSAFANFSCFVTNTCD
ncbi:uncharacterized protein LOC131938188 [Physella acuta]|uniref:uncharacterized protein LOC131938188 n=1 Tax=Physella acuta TaxID=109671 RepID=UPI0027DC1BA2|nr:uncharacterized protein LOC131938188 [Physella acuta]